MSEIFLGTVQLGMKYGVTNAEGMPDAQSCNEILQTALNLGVKGFDTAQAYGDSEERIGQFLAAKPAAKPVIQTKILPLRRTTLKPHQLVEASFKRLNVEYIDVCMMHRFEDMADSLMLATLNDYVEKGHIGKIGCSVSTPREFIGCLAVSELSFIQFPLNLLDWRWREAGAKVAKMKRKDLSLQARSIFLQGLLLAQASQFPKMPGLDVEALCTELDSLQRRMGFSSRAELCFSFVFGQSWVNSIVFGVNRVSELTDLAKSFKVRPMSVAELKMVEDLWKLVPEKFLNPANWS